MNGRAEGILVYMDGKFYYVRDVWDVVCSQCGHLTEVDMGDLLMDATEDV